MIPDPLDHPIWHSLTGPHARFAMVHGSARRFRPEIGPLSAMERDDEAGLADLAALVPQDAPLFTMQAHPHPAPPGIAIERRAALQMVAKAAINFPDANIDMQPLTVSDAPDMLALATLTEPGPFAPRTSDLSQFWGVKIDRQLVAMAGERLRLANYSEVSGVCVHPDFRGRGYAGALMRKVMTQMRVRGETPFLTTYAHNSGAIALYERIGFRTRREMVITVMKRAT